MDELYPLTQGNFWSYRRFPLIGWENTAGDDE